MFTIKFRMLRINFLHQIYTHSVNSIFIRVYRW
nr:MAG TPA: hypothetical protein [Caudoviricetes sp.]